MKKPYEIHSDFFKKMIASGWYENREIILDSLPHHLEELTDNVKKFLREIWYLTISYDTYYRSNVRIFLSTVLHNFGGNYIMVEHSQPDGLVSCYEYDRYDTDGKVLKSSNYLGEEWRFDYRKDHTVVTDTFNTQGIFRQASSWQTHHLIPQAVWKENKTFF